MSCIDNCCQRFQNIGEGLLKNVLEYWIILFGVYTKEFKNKNKCETYIVGKKATHTLENSFDNKFFALFVSCVINN